MTTKKESILKSALELFANEGVNATSTKKIAEHAGVSEGLIFKHFSTKKALLDAIIANGEEKVAILWIDILQQSNPKEVIKKTIELPFSIKKTEYDFWKLQFKLKWEESYNNPQKMQPLKDSLSQAFAQLNYEKPKIEAELLVHIIESVSTEILKGNLENGKQLKTFLMDKYEV